MDKYDAIIVGLGAMGSASAYQLAKGGRKVLGIDRFAPPHTLGSSHGETRITRLAIGEGVHYTPIVMRSHEIWREVEKETGAQLLTTTGGLIMSSASRTSRLHVDDFFSNTVAAAEKYNIAHNLLDAKDIRRHFPTFAVRDDEIGYYEPAAGFLRPEACIAAQLGLAANLGATVHPNETVRGFEPSSGAVSVTTDRSTYETETLILTAGAWLPELIGPRYTAPFRVLRQLLFWFDVDGPIEPFEPPNCPVFIWELQGPKQAMYGFPAIDGPRGGVKVATQQYEHTTTPDRVNRTVSPDEAAAMHRTFVAPYFPALSNRCIKAVACLYTATPDSEFVIDRHPQSERIIIASPCSGHGFKHSAAIGEALAELATHGKTRLDLSAFSLARFAL
jgi:sarcosine oxidase